MGTPKTGVRQLVVSDPSLAAPIRFDVGDTLDYDLGVTDRSESVVGATGVVGPKETRKPSHIEASVNVGRGNIDWLALSKVDDATVTLVDSNNDSHTITGAWCTKYPQTSATDGTATVRFESALEGRTSRAPR